MHSSYGMEQVVPQRGHLVPWHKLKNKVSQKSRWPRCGGLCCGTQNLCGGTKYCRSLFYAAKLLTLRTPQTCFNSQTKIPTALLLKKLVCCFLPSSCFHLNLIKQVGVRYHVASKIKELNEMLDHIAIEKNRYEFVENPIAIEHIERETTSFKDISKVYG